MKLFKLVVSVTVISGGSIFGSMNSPGTEYVVPEGSGLI